MKTLLILPLFAVFLLRVVADEQDKAPSETTAGWFKHPKNPCLEAISEPASTCPF
jgi:hypothetical protein